ncbi:54S ribosomal protein L12 [Pyrus ussuriensis x Pyrus communis]|uniref:54S ribosomal protein L12 n=1 Tax=Pyrus ussuriensis x Pyrus communis TaxID=2448454 RepID=A0A5N5EZ42_9ROSA|nr:54S ribosomal protein L12 [Pyrus ussuriensis x Pyrus communis]
MPEQQQQENGLGWSYGNYVPPDHLSPVLSLRDSTQFQEPAAALYAQEAIAARQGMPQQTPEQGIGSYYGIRNSVTCNIPNITNTDLEMKNLESKYHNQLEEPKK